jgi:hypothetical protein
VRDVVGHFVCEGRGEAGLAAVRPGRHAGDVEFACPFCGFVNVMTVAPGIGAAAGVEAPVEIVEVDDWRTERSRAVVGAGTRPIGEGDDRFRAGERTGRRVGRSTGSLTPLVQMRGGLAALRRRREWWSRGKVRPHRSPTDRC